MESEITCRKRSIPRQSAKDVLRLPPASSFLPHMRSEYTFFRQRRISSSRRLHPRLKACNEFLVRSWLLSSAQIALDGGTERVQFISVINCTIFPYNSWRGSRPSGTSTGGGALEHGAALSAVLRGKLHLTHGGIPALGKGRQRRNIAPVERGGVLEKSQGCQAPAADHRHVRARKSEMRTAASGENTSPLAMTGILTAFTSRMMFSRPRRRHIYARAPVPRRR